MRRVVIALAVAGALLAACSEPPRSGTIYKMPYQGESYWYSSHCGMYNTVTRSRYVATYDSKGRQSGGRWQTYTEQVCIMHVQDTHVVPPVWQICVQADDDPKHKGCFEVPRSTWEQYHNGYHYPDPR